MPGHRLPEHRLCPGHQGHLSGPGRPRHRQHVAGHLRRRGRDDPGCPQRHPRPVRQEALTLRPVLQKVCLEHMVSLESNDCFC